MPASIYPWDEWFTLDRFVLRAGKDYHTSQSSMAQQVRSEAHRRRFHELGLRVGIEDAGDRLVVTIIPLKVSA
jgi:hypothetical protein